MLLKCTVGFERFISVTCYVHCSAYSIKLIIVEFSTDKCHVSENLKKGMLNYLEVWYLKF